jgi:hypothetical protein
MPDAPTPSSDPTPNAVPIRLPRFTPAPGCGVELRTVPGGTDVAVLLLDSSVGGVGLLVCKSLAPAQPVLVTLAEPGRPPAQYSGTVRWCRPVYAGLCRVGIRLNRSGHEHPKSAVGNTDISPTGSQTERRAWGRGAAAPGCQVICRKGLLDLGIDYALGLVDVSATGARLLVSEPLARWEVLSLAFLGPNPRRPLKRTGTVRWCASTGQGAHCVGVALDRRLADYDLRLLTKEPDTSC